ncbi:N-acyl homoserine lactonase family protein [Agathobaculum sp.]|uniref:N-acyl homoserine lactonase family protein n=1 Tax=Agathobaculum sp. TaxID=2048138 RepID=UPI002A812E7F|nr:N-acyl homoserine lactonase family protein [Agathobaculum sp.]MDY3617607.1 N-acyl homoserine lactonase family protein [Agathobaculum sp.]
MLYTITPLLLGRFVAHEKSAFTYKKDFGVGLDAPLFSFLVQGGGRSLLFDCGPENPEDAPHTTHRTITHHVSLESRLSEHGLNPADIDAVIVSHLHWDHSYNLELFPHAPIYVQADEVRAALTPMPCEAHNYNVKDGNGLPQWLKGYESMVLLEGDFALDDGLSIVTLPGHSPGLHGLLVDTAEGKCLLASDHFPLLENFTSGIPAGSHTSLTAWYASFEKAKRLADFVLPGHDDTVLAKPVYGV